MGRLNAHDSNDFFIKSVDKSAHESMIHCKIVLLDGVFKYPPSVSSWIPTVANHSSCLSVHAAYVLKIAFKVLAYRFVFLFADSSFSKLRRLIESGAN